MEQEYSPLSFKGMSTSRDAPNPLRPYYIPPSIGLPPDAANASTNSGNGRIPPSSSSRNFHSSARDMFSDIDYETYLPERDGGGVAEAVKKLMDQAIWNYTSVLLAQPFEVAKVVLQCHLAGDEKSVPLLGGPLESGRGVERSYFDGRHHEDSESEEDSDSDAPSYFAPTAPYETPSSPHRNRRHKPPSRSLSATPTPSNRSAIPPTSSSSRYLLDLRKSDSLLEVLSQLWSKEGAWGIWKGTNSTFVYNVLLKIIETWTRGLLSALMNLPDPALVSIGASTTPGGLNILDSPNPMAGIAVAVAAAGLAGLALAPIDMIRTRLILTPVTSAPRSLYPSLWSLESWICPPSLIPITLLHSTIPPLLSTSTPLLLRNSLYIDPTHTPTTSSISTFCISLAELFVKLPLETILRRGHISVLSTSHATNAMREKYNHLPTTDGKQSEKFKTIVPVGPYKGVWGTLWFIVREEGQSIPVSAQVAGAVKQGELRRQPPPRRGQGVHGLWRGWRVGFWGLVGMWSASAFGGSGEGAF